jgi:phosphonate transport system substrate-binding protein
VDSLIWEYAARTNPALTSRTRVIVTSPAYGIPPVVASPHLAADLKERVRQVLLNAHRDAQGKEIMQGMMIERFEPIEDRAYESIREMKRWLAQRKQPGAG